MKNNFEIKNNIPEFYAKVLTIGLEQLKKKKFSSIEIEIPVKDLADKYNLGSRESVRKKIMELFYFMDASCIVADTEEFSTVLHTKYEIERDSIRIMYNEMLINRLMDLADL